MVQIQSQVSINLVNEVCWYARMEYHLEIQFRDDICVQVSEMHAKFAESHYLVS